MNSKSILIVHPYDRTTFFLERIKNHLQNNFGDGVHYFSVKPNDASHNECLATIKTHIQGGLIIFLGHGRSDKLYGGKAEKSSALVSESARSEIPEDYYNNENFINKTNIEIFNSKKVFCLACNSNDKISDYAMDKEAISFLGFGDIPTSIGEFAERGKAVSKDIIKLMKSEINYIIKKSLVYGIKSNYSFENLNNLINLITNQRIMDILVNRKRLKERYLLADFLFFFKSEIKIKGDKKEKLIT